MLNRYLGNKKELLEPIMRVVGAACPPGGRVCDAFSGTLAVSLELKRRGYGVVANDINPFSATYGEAFLLPSGLPAAPLAELVPARRRGALREEATRLAETLRGADGFGFLERAADRERYEGILAVLLHLARLRPADLPREARRRDFLDTYTEEGRNSAFVSRRGTRGRRRFFTGENARRIDAILCQLRAWRREGLTSPALHALLLCVLLEGIERVSNTQGTYHDFPRDEWDPRAFAPLRLAPPAMDVVFRGGEHVIGRAEDSLEFIRRAPAHDVLYLDPPYNFRQYTSYYFLPNLVCEYADLEDLDDYFSKVEFVRGQNMATDFDSPFCSKDRFLESLAALVSRARADTVVLSYFDGRNHWNDFKREAAGVGYEELAGFFGSPLFAPGSLEVVPVKRLNYQSYGGYKAKEVSEYLFTARKAEPLELAAGGGR